MAAPDENRSSRMAIIRVAAAGPGERTVTRVREPRIAQAIRVGEIEAVGDRGMATIMAVEATSADGCSR